jgi:Ca2+-binding RTX toxin-like protein
MFESLETRQLLSATAPAAPAVAPENILTIDATDKADRISIFRTSDDFLIIDHLVGHVDKKTGEFIPETASDRRPVSIRDVELIVVNGGLGDDVIDVSAAGRPAALDGGKGDDVLVGSEFDDVLIGGDGDDALYGLGGSDVLSGGKGKDFLDGGEDGSPDTYDGGQGRDTAVVRTPPPAIWDVEIVTDGRG